MTENKRFTVKQRQGATIYSIIDYYGELPLSEGMYYKSNAEKLCKWLNALHEENEQLKTMCDAVREELSLADRDNTALEKENEQLKKEIQQLRHWNKCLAEKRHDILRKIDNIDYGHYVDNKTKKELEEMLNRKGLNCSDRD